MLTARYIRVRTSVGRAARIPIYAPLLHQSSKIPIPPESFLMQNRFPHRHRLAHRGAALILLLGPAFQWQTTGAVLAVKRMVISVAPGHRGAPMTVLWKDSQRRFCRILSFVVSGSGLVGVISRNRRCIGTRHMAARD